MKTQTFVTSAVVLTLLAVAQSEVITEPENDIENYSIIDPIIKAILEKLKPKLANIAMEDINKEIKEPNLNATISVKNILIQYLDSFVTRSLKSTIVPLRLTNLTLTWDKVLATATYDVDASIAIPELQVPVRIYGKGDARGIVYGTLLTVGANMELKDKTVQVKPKGLFGFDIRVSAANASFSSLMGSQEFGKMVGEYIGRVIPDAVDSLKQPVFDAFHDTIVGVINQVLKNYGSLFMDEEIDLPDLSLLEEYDQSEEVAEELDSEELDSEETEFEV